MGLLYFYSSIVYFLTFNFVRYRRKVVRENLRKAFPEKNDLELREIEKGFYKHFIDFIFESIKAISISKQQVLKRTRLKNPELLDKYYKDGRSLIVVCGHFNNWEYYALSLPFQTTYSTYSVYQPLKNTFYDKILYKSRTRNGMNLVKTRDIIPFFSETADKQKMVIVVNDQSPSNIQKAHWNTFLNQETGWNTGPEKLAKKYDYSVLFGCSSRVKRGYYEVEFTPISPDPVNTSDGEITDAYSRILEDLIREKPQYWLWSHKRWKHKRPSAN